MFEFLKWGSSFKKYGRGVKRGDILFKRPRPFFDFTKKVDWLKFLLLVIFGPWIAALVGIIAFFVVSGFAGGFVLTVNAWEWLFAGGWLLFWFLHFVHSLRFCKIAKLTNVDFVPLSKARGIGERLLTMPENLTATDYNILYSRYIWADVEGEPYRDVTDWVERIANAQAGGPAVSVGGGDFATSVGRSIGGAIGLKYSESKVKEIIDIAGGIPSPQEIVKILQTELVPKYRELLGEKLMSLYLVFLVTQPPTLPYTESTTRSDMRAVANAKDTYEVLDYLNKFAPKVEK